VSRKDASLPGSRQTRVFNREYVLSASAIESPRSAGIRMEIKREVIRGLRSGQTGGAEWLIMERVLEECRGLARWEKKTRRSVAVDKSGNKIPRGGSKVPRIGIATDESRIRCTERLMQSTRRYMIAYHAMEVDHAAPCKSAKLAAHGARSEIARE